MKRVATNKRNHHNYQYYWDKQKKPDQIRIDFFFVEMQPKNARNALYQRLAIIIIFFEGEIFRFFYCICVYVYARNCWEFAKSKEKKIQQKNGII